MLTPAISVILTRIITKEGFRNLYLAPHFKGNKKWYFSAYFLTPIVAIFGAFVYFLIFRNDFDLLGSAFAKESGATTINEYITVLATTIPLAIVVNPLMGIVQCFGEEFAWRGYLLPKLIEKFSVQKAVIINGVIWGIWHSPLIAMGYNYGDEHPVFGIIAMIIFCVVLGIIESFLFYKTQSIWCSVIFHASINGMDTWSPSVLFMSKMPNMFVGPNLLGIIGGIGFVIVAVILFAKLKPERPVQ
jgi:membrane protease YdiL (CAAX protease family)